MKKLIILISALSLSGCFWQSVRPVDIKASESFCADKGGVHSIDSLWSGEVQLYCENLYDKSQIRFKVRGESWTTTGSYLKQEYVK